MRSAAATACLRLAAGQGVRADAAWPRAVAVGLSGAERYLHSVQHRRPRRLQPAGHPAPASPEAYAATAGSQSPRARARTSPRRYQLMLAPVSIGRSVPSRLHRSRVAVETPRNSAVCLRVRRRSSSAAKFGGSVRGWMGIDSPALFTGADGTQPLAGKEPGLGVSLRLSWLESLAEAERSREHARAHLPELRVADP
jgi:hypothetical protein